MNDVLKEYLCIQITGLGYRVEHAEWDEIRIVLNTHFFIRATMLVSNNSVGFGPCGQQIQIADPEFNSKLRALLAECSVRFICNGCPRRLP